MSTNSAPKVNSLKSVQLHSTDTGSTPVQIHLLTERIECMKQHLKQNPKDIVTKRSLLRCVAIRKKLQRQLAI